MMATVHREASWFLVWHGPGWKRVRAKLAWEASPFLNLKNYPFIFPSSPINRSVASLWNFFTFLQAFLQLKNVFVYLCLQGFPEPFSRSCFFIPSFLWTSSSFSSRKFRRLGRCLTAFFVFSESCVMNKEDECASFFWCFFWVSTVFWEDMRVLGWKCKFFELKP